MHFGLRPDFRGIMLEHPLYFFQISPSARHLPLKKLRQISVKVTPHVQFRMNFRHFRALEGEEVN
jgi:hypothetical protein